MDLSELFHGIAVIVDDEIHVEKTSIKMIADQIRAKKIPVLTYESHPDIDKQHLQAVSFVLLDWEIISEEARELKLKSHRLPGTLIAEYEAANIVFLKDLLASSFCPIFIFTHESTDRIKQRLIDEKLFNVDKPNNIFIKSKKDLESDGAVFAEISNWLKSSPSIYVLKEWEIKYQSSKTKLFRDFQEFSPHWPRIMWQNFEKDGTNSSIELGSILSKNLHTRMSPYQFKSEIINSQFTEIDRDELLKVIEGERFLSSDNLHSDDISTGDLFKVSKYYYLNIRPACDLIPREAGESIDDVELYLVRGTKLTSPTTATMFSPTDGKFRESDCNIIIFPLNNGQAIDFRFKKFEIKKWKDCKSNRIGRILPPHITRAQQRFSLYLQREGLPRTPNEAIPVTPQADTPVT
jgi:hypothetical protein